MGIRRLATKEIADVEESSNHKGVAVEGVEDLRMVKLVP